MRTAKCAPLIGIFLLLLFEACGSEEAEPPSGGDTESSETAVPANPTFIQEISWAPDGSRLLFSQLDIAGDQYRIFSIRPDGSDQILLSEGARDLWTSWSPDGTKIAFASSRDGNPEIYVMNSDGGSPARLTDHPASDSEPSWSPDGSMIAFTSEREGERRIFGMSADGSNPRRVTNGPGPEYAPRWSPDGGRIAFYATVADGDDRVVVVNADGSERKEIAKGVWPSWSPDGSSLLFSPPGGGLVVQPLDGTEGQTLVADNVVLGEWSPDGSRLGFVRVTWRSPEGWPSQSEIFLADPDGSNIVPLTQ